ncbi:MAG: hypothetical protein IKH67_08040 [Lachnospiraceae bacterium]|nr:hypothetical protein [Lachnospiraceae bacterium]
MSSALDYGMRFGHTGVHGYNLKEAIQWHIDTFDMHAALDLGHNHGHSPMVQFVKVGDSRIELYEVKNGYPVSLHDMEQYICAKWTGLAVVEYDEWLKHAKEIGTKIIFEGDGMCMVNDPSGVPYKVKRDWLKEDTIYRGGKWGTRVESFAMTVYNIEETAFWYGEMFGFKRLPDEDYVCPKCGQKVGIIDLDNFRMELFENPDAKPFTLMDFEYYVGCKHLDIYMKDRAGWTEYMQTLKSQAPVIVSMGNRAHPELGPLPHYVLDNNNYLMEMSDDGAYDRDKK